MRSTYRIIYRVIIPRFCTTRRLFVFPFKVVKNYLFYRKFITILFSPTFWQILWELEQHWVSYRKGSGSCGGGGATFGSTWTVGTMWRAPESATAAACPFPQYPRKWGPAAAAAWGQKLGEKDDIKGCLKTFENSGRLKTQTNHFQKSISIL